jgi:hypothetical protein
VNYEQIGDIVHSSQIGDIVHPNPPGVNTEKLPLQEVPPVAPSRRERPVCGYSAVPFHPPPPPKIQILHTFSVGYIVQKLVVIFSEL